MRRLTFSTMKGKFYFVPTIVYTWAPEGCGCHQVIFLLGNLKIAYLKYCRSAVDQFLMAVAEAAVEEEEGGSK